MPTYTIFYNLKGQTHELEEHPLSLEAAAGIVANLRRRGFQAWYNRSL